MEKRRVFSKAGFCLVLALSISLLLGLEGPGIGKESGEAGGIRFWKGGQSEPIPVMLFENIIYLPVKVNGSQALVFVLDTGASDVTAVDEGTAGSLGLRSSQGGTVRGAGSEAVATRLLEGVSFSVSGMDISGFRTITIPLKRMEPYWGKKKEGLLGGNLLGRVVFRIDYEIPQVTFFDPKSYSAFGQGQVVPLTIQANTPFVKARVAAEGGGEAVEGLFLLDTGVRQTFINTPFTARNKLLERSRRKVENITGFGISGVTRGLVGRVASIRIADFRLERPVVELCTETEGIGASAAFDGIIGADILSRFRVVFDYTGRRMILEKSKNFGEPFEYDMAGLYMIAQGEANDRFMIANVVRDSPAAEAGLEEGDEILTVDKKEASSFTLETLRRYFRKEGRTVSLNVRRDGKKLSLTLCLKRLV